MKKILTLLTALALTLSVFSGALAAPGDKLLFYRENQDDPYSSMQSMAGDDQYLYVVKSGDSDGNVYALVRYDIAADKLETLVDDLPQPYYSSLEDFEAYGNGGDASRVINRLFMSENGVCALNYLTGQVSRLIYENGVLTFEKLGEFDTSPLQVKAADYSYTKEIWGACLQGDVLYISTYSYETEPKSELMSFDLKTGKSGALPSVFAHDLVSYKDGQLITIKYDPENSYDQQTYEPLPREIHTVDLKSGQTRKLFTVDKYAAGLAYDKQSDRIYYTAGSTVMGVSPDGKSEKVAYLPSSDSYSVQGASYANGLYAVGTYSGVAIRNIDPQYLPSTVLSIYGSYANEKDISFQKAHPDVALDFMQTYYSSLEDLAQAMSATDAIDIVSAYSSDSSINLDVLIAKGYCLDLSEYPELNAYAQKLYPYLLDYVSRDGKLYAVPIYASHTSNAYYTEVLKAMELTQENLPKTYPELFAFIDRWNDEWVYDYPDYTPFYYGQSLRQELLYKMIGDYVLYCKAQGGDIDFSTPLFKSLMTSFDAMRTDNLDNAAKNGEEIWSRQTLFEPGGYEAVDFSSPEPEKGSDYYKVWDLRLAEDIPMVFGTHVQVMFVNPKSPNRDMAAAYLSHCVANLSTYTLPTLDATMTKSVENPYFEEMIKNWKDDFERVKESYAKADESEKKDLEWQIENYEELLSNQERYRYNITEQALKYYKDYIVDRCVVSGDNFIYSESNKAIRDLLDLYLAKSRTVDQFINELERKMRMIILEGK